MVDWKKVADEYNREVAQIQLYFTGRQCKERWFNHLCPFLNKYCEFFYFFFKFLYRNKWSSDEDLLVLSECRENGWKWGKVAKSFIHRNQHQIKNRFIYLMSKGLECERKNLLEMILEMIRRKSLDAAVLSVLQELRVGQILNFTDIQSSETIL